ncbi:probable inactive purple acid phosphatase 16 [Asparagus officinalis]|uniref:probable inactive purple acid phosphatase 16 n=1 Tax=Asparagus officinalis TaxID=4686 RepID=UPI00098E16FE|nr:probable inactive purple acid phosphatase 16 [Asparagus officinalis]
MPILIISIIAALHFLAGDGRCVEVPVLRQTTGKSLQFSGDSRFKIALFADLHYGENAWTEWGPAQEKSERVMAAVLDKETPDFVIYLGDVITANNLPIPNATMYWDCAISPTRKRGIPWATIFGNHDDASFVWPSEWFSATGIPQVCCPPTNFSVSGERECSFGGAKRIELVNMEIERNTLSYSHSGPRELWPSVSNYVLQVSSSTNGKLPVVFLYFLDSGGGSYPEVISHAQAKWFEEQSQLINPDARIPEVIFWHIPSEAYKKVAPMPIFGIHKPCVGSINKERVASQEAEWGTMDILLHRSSVKAVFVGHNHGLDWCCPYKNLWLCFARHTGYGGYGNWARGSRILEMTENPFSLKSWIRMEDGSEHSYVILSS